MSFNMGRQFFATLLTTETVGFTCDLGKGVHLFTVILYEICLTLASMGKCYQQSQSHDVSQTFTDIRSLNVMNMFQIYLIANKNYHHKTVITELTGTGSTAICLHQLTCSTWYKS